MPWRAIPDEPFMSGSDDKFSDLEQEGRLLLGTSINF